MKRIAVLTSGGDAPGMNAAIRAVVRGALYHKIQVYGIERGYEGLINGEIKEMNVSSVSDILQRGGTMLKTARSKRFMTPEGFQRAMDMLENFEIEGLVVIGGDGSFRGGLELTKAGITVMGLPGTIDNDLAYTDFTIGFDTAVNTVLSAIGNIRDTSSAHERSTVIEVMGRHCGDIALYAGLTGGAESILIPEEPVDINAICRKLIQGRNRGKLHNIIIRAEGVEISSQELAQVITDRTGMETKVVVLGYIQRGGSPTAGDRILASRMGYKAIELLMEDSTSKAIGVCGSEIISYDLETALNMTGKHNKSLMELADMLSI
ncbi:6-phosphofructokinase [Sinanaerobacter chloroacetimidivorans]|uniref:ATP-dependent 6-phosphofructokinase n=1 Tax=Sinanaerobacter chloroacetimidivorans TaxID=2818044 RepID=A0A8J8B3Y3_9FIRM|nr:6-phosphofructokinase [Sinanaerobacter chloroacetimidivorans]MBR0598795.1 6-phosphofructokinase [Sinanaerobacter chloroacetimidivorans]